MQPTLHAAHTGSLTQTYIYIHTYVHAMSYIPSVPYSFIFSLHLTADSSSAAAPSVVKSSLFTVCIASSLPSPAGSSCCYTAFFVVSLVLFHCFFHQIQSYSVHFVVRLAVWRF